MKTSKRTKDEILKNLERGYENIKNEIETGKSDTFILSCISGDSEEIGAINLNGNIASLLTTLDAALTGILNSVNDVGSILEGNVSYTRKILQAASSIGRRLYDLQGIMLKNYNQSLIHDNLLVIHVLMRELVELEKTMYDRLRELNEEENED